MRSAFDPLEVVDVARGTTRRRLDVARNGRAIVLVQGATTHCLPGLVEVPRVARTDDDARYAG